MQIILFVVLALLGLIGLLLIAALLMKKEYFIERDVVITRSQEEVFDYVRFLRNQDHYSKWVMMDPNMKRTFSGEDGKVGAIYGWNGNERAGEGEQEIVAIIENQRLDIEIRFKRPFESVAKVHMTTEALLPNKTRVTWGMTGTSKYPFNVMSPILNKMLGKDLQESLNTLREALEKSSVGEKVAV